MATLIFVTTAALLGYRLLWRRMCRIPPGLGARLLRGRIQGGEPGRLELNPGDGSCIVLGTAGAQVVAWPGPGAWRLRGNLQVGDPVTVLALEEPGALAALRIIRGAWPASPLPQLSSAVVAVVCGIALLRLLVAPIAVERQFDPPFRAPLLLDAPDPARTLAAARQLGRLNGWSGAGQTGQSFLEYLGSGPNVADRKRRYLYLQPVGHFDPRQRHLLRSTAHFLARFYCLPVRVAEGLSLDEIPRHAQRLHPEWGNTQLLTSYLLHGLFRWRRPADAAGYLGITAVDLWPGPGWEAVYGQASLVARVGVVSFHRHGDLDSDFRLVLLRTIKVAAHETGHMFSIRHCANRGCLMSGHNDRQEADARFPVLCPDCLAKLVWATRCDPVQRYAGLAAFCREHQLHDEATLYGRLMAAASEAWGRPEPARLAASY